MQKTVRTNKEHVIYATNSLLNLPSFESTAAISSKIEVDKKYNSTHGSFQISDCSRSVSLSFDVSKKEDYENSLHKIQMVIDNAIQFKKNIELARKDYIKYKKKRKQNKKE